MTSPRVSIIMPVYNGQAHLQEAMDSVLRQVWQDWELIIVDDGSTDATADILRAQADARIRFVWQPHQGIVAALLHGLAEARGEYIARLDADDISRPDRLVRQVTWLDAHPEDSLVASDYDWIIDGVHVPHGRILPQSHEGVRAHLLFWCCICHSSVMWRRADFEAHGLVYRDAFPHAEDYDLWVRAVDHVRCTILPERLVAYRQHPAQVTQTHFGPSRISGRRLHALLLDRLGIAYTEEELDVHTRCLEAAGPAFDAWCQRLLAHNERVRVYDPAALAQAIDEIRRFRRIPPAARIIPSSGGTGGS
ncbi:MAG: glycosyltransferase [Thermoflavifilum sp.]|nr:glycosyltransferase [Thermoflavifilum sp.]MCL6514054.1 glycosyltransferase [Alicyclobacillus sp.]